MKLGNWGNLLAGIGEILDNHLLDEGARITAAKVMELMKCMEFGVEQKSPPALAEWGVYRINRYGNLNHPGLNYNTMKEWFKLN